MQKDSIYYMWLCYSMWRDCKINYFSCQQGWSPIVKTTSNFYELLDKAPFLAPTAKAALGAVGTPRAAKGTQGQPPHCHSSLKSRGAAPQPIPKALGGSVLQHGIAGMHQPGESPPWECIKQKEQEFCSFT